MFNIFVLKSVKINVKEGELTNIHAAQIFVKT